MMANKVKAVVVLMPPAVEPGEPPMSIKAMRAGSSRFAEILDVDRVVACGAGRNGLKEGDQEVFAEGRVWDRVRRKRRKCPGMQE